MSIEVNIENDKIYFTDRQCCAGFCLDIALLDTDDIIDLKYKFIDELNKRCSRIYKQ